MTDFFIKNGLRSKNPSSEAQKLDPKFGIDNLITGLIFSWKKAFVSKISAQKSENWTRNLGLIFVITEVIFKHKNGVFTEIRALIYCENNTFESWEAQKLDPKFGIDNLITWLIFQKFELRKLKIYRNAVRACEIFIPKQLKLIMRACVRAKSDCANVHFLQVWFWIKKCSARTKLN